MLLYLSQPNCRVGISVLQRLPKPLRRVRLPYPAPCKKPLLSTGQKRFFTMISVPVGTGDIADTMISASQMIYASRMNGTDVISYLRSKYIMRRQPYIISHQRYIIIGCCLIEISIVSKAHSNKIPPHPGWIFFDGHKCSESAFAADRPLVNPPQI